MAFDEKYISELEFQKTYCHTAKTRAAIRGFINYLVKFEETKQHNKSKP